MYCFSLVRNKFQKPAELAPAPDYDREWESLWTDVFDSVPDVSRWLEGLDHTANRLGFLVCNDLSEAVQTIRNEMVIISRASVADRIQELILFSISDEYFALRKGLGVSIHV